MRLFVRLLVAFVITVVTLVVFMPPIVGITLQRYGNAIFSGVNPYFTTEVLQYDRGWFSSDVIFKIRPTSELLSKLQNFSTDDSILSDHSEFKVKAHVQHGPIFYSSHRKNKHCMGLALVTRKLIPTEDQRNFFSLLGNENIIKNNGSYLSFTGKYNDFFELQNLRFITEEGISVELSKLSTQIWTYQNKIDSDINLDQFSLGDENTTFLIPHLKLNLNLKKVNGLWLGDQSLFVSNIEMIDAGESLRLSNIELNGELSESNDLINGDRSLTIRTIAYNDQAFGPLQIILSISNLNAKAISNIITTYQDITEHGEMYESQLRQKIVALAPSIIGPDTTLSLDKLHIQTSNGTLWLHAKAYWPADNYSAQNSIQALAEMASVKTDFKVSVPLANQLINVLARFTYVYQIPNQERQILMDLQNNMRFMTQVNAYNILNYIDSGVLPKEDGVDLLTKIRNNISREDYVEEIKKLLLARKISLLASYELNFLYMMLYQQYDEFDRRIAVLQKHTEELIRDQFNLYLKEGVIQQENNEYKMSLVREKSKLIINGKSRPSQ